MKFIISILLLSKAQASLLVIHHENNLQHAKIFKEILTADYQIPENLIEVRETRACEEIVPRKKFELCVKSNEELIVLNAERSFIELTMKSFSQNH